ncbi:transporter associated domain-containing protein [Alkaliphilus peptidifermentans]|uniref:Transporter associated domain-containing protein n=1 Tax=Alkaliphilus peptidifermentans DSM 18978 TaxID=1120976 RepID=A0A1G5F1M7_9FIRM|nr:transporter associated domain-containing protein [Alkaliphilus peptidifermentans]SCY33155.1 Transporter associated domain-containing protein [Alkaliphilus peptidifermentans DSM 18978]
MDYNLLKEGLTMLLENAKKKLVKCATGLELLLALCIIIAIGIGLITIVKYLVIIYQTDVTYTYEVFKKFLSVSLLLVIGVELVLMLLSHSTSSILELVLFAIARKMLVYSETPWDLLLGTAAIAIVFLIRKFLMSPKYSFREGRIISAASPVHALNFEGDLDIPEDKGNTVGGLICHLSEETCIPVEEGAEYEIGDITMKILKMKDGLIEQVVLNESKNESKKVKSHS